MRRSGSSSLQWQQPISEDDKKIKESEANVLSQNLTGFASCFPDWDLHPPVA